MIQLFALEALKVPAESLAISFDQILLASSMSKVDLTNRIGVKWHGTS